jgi:hypothetical protein
MTGGDHLSVREREGAAGSSPRAGLLGRWLRAGPVGLVSLFFSFFFLFYVFFFVV